MIELVITVVLVIAVSALCSLFEAALYALPQSHIESMAASGRRAGKILQQLRRDVDRPIAAILSLNTIANTAGAAVAGALAARVFGSAWVGYFSAVFTLLILVLSEVIPKTAGVTYSRALAGAIARPLQALVWFFAPLIWLTRRVTRLMSTDQQEQGVSAEELIVMARLGQKTGGIEADEVQVIQGVLSLREKTVRQIMTPRTVMFALSADLTVQQVQEQIGALNHSRAPVYDQDIEDVVGIVHRREILTTLAKGQADVKIEALMHPPEFVEDSLPVDRLLQRMLKGRQHMAVVCDEFGGLAGLVTLEDVIEEVLGEEIVDEFDPVVDMRELAHRRRQELMKGRQQD